MAIARWLQLAALSLAMAAPAAPTLAQEPAGSYPAKPIRLVVPAAPGGPTDAIGRLVAERLSRGLGQPVLVDNKPGAAQILGTALVAKADPDGYTLLFAPSTALLQAPLINKTVTYDVKRDFALLANVGTTQLVFYANAKVPAASIKELIALARAKPGELSYGSWGTGSSGHLLGEYMSRQAGIKLVHVPYKGMGPELTDLVGGQIDFGVADVGTPAGFVKSGQLRPVAIAGAARVAALPDVPTFAEQGIPGMEPFSPWLGVLAPAATPKPILDKLAGEMAKIGKMPDFTGQLAVLGYFGGGRSASQATEAMDDELARWRKIIAALPDVKLE